MAVEYRVSIIQIGGCYFSDLIGLLRNTMWVDANYKDNVGSFRIVKLIKKV